jgi:hypothetical protein
MSVCHLLDANIVEAGAHQPVRSIFRRAIVRQVTCPGLYMFFGFGKMGVVGQFLAVEVGFDGLEIHHAYLNDWSSAFLCYGTRSFHLPHISATFATGSGCRQMLGLLGAVYLLYLELSSHVVRSRCWQNPCPCQSLGEGRRNSGRRPP